MLEAALQGGPGLVNMAGFHIVDPANDPILENEITPVNVLSPQSVKWRYPAGQSFFNPASFPGDVASLVEAKFTAECLGRPAEFNMDKCRTCWALPSPFENSDSIRGRVLVYTFNDATTSSVRLYSPSSGTLPTCSHRRCSGGQACLWYYYELLLVAQEAGAIGVIVASENRLPALIPSAVPFQVQVPM